MITKNYIIRSPLSEAEWAEVKRLLLNYKNEFNDDSCFTSFEAEMTDIENLYAKNDKLKLIAVTGSGSEIAGCVALRALTPEVSEMKRLYVVPMHRGHQLGRKLAEAIIHEATIRGYQKMILDTMIEMESAQQLYRQLGFEMIPPYNNQDPLKVVCYGKQLKAK